MSVSPIPPEKQSFRDSTCGHIVGLLLLCYGVFNTYLFFHFEPVYVATQCGDQTADLEDLSLGETIKVALKIQVTCWNGNAYEVEIKTSEPGYVYIGAGQDYKVGQLTLMRGSRLPAQGSGDIRVEMDAELSKEDSERLVPLFLRAEEIPMFLDLQFEVNVNVNFGLLSFGTTAAFKKKCGMKLAGLLTNANSRLGPMICKDDILSLQGQVPAPGETPQKGMSFSGAQMDPDRIAMGETAKNISTISVGLVCYVFGFSLVYHWIKTSCCADPKPQPVEAQYMIAGQPRSCFRASSGNLQADMDMTARHSARDWWARMRGQQVEPPPPPQRSPAVATLLKFLTCGTAAKRPTPPMGDSSPQPAYFKRQCMRGDSGNLAELARPVA